ncbi:hypothetical protein TCAL_00531 [Tigriopus californicus]|uniref:Large ribosomal subunit protein uL4m n=1 Tax=Tigriopus californicus TaxID=6832 RepID=A0A553PAZ8_TIGCA|nr:large ribosomal subunit protein uL4m-like [Tigriopus californicus]TRY74848.1 hypothetical protein TCAL_00531 [Tigriopus californicus]|eukprot:TCALIF_00531-PA protein Name:"Similar to MRPL4 39S ribosomal protein L4, mitochondrial (Bos taurus)" AED:0.03 eAED:0.03 QI:147/1/1/1/1/1/2/56/342
MFQICRRACQTPRNVLRLLAVPRYASFKAPDAAASNETVVSDLDQIPAEPGTAASSERPSRRFVFHDEDLDNESSRIRPPVPPSRETIFRQYPPESLAGVTRYAWLETLDASEPRTDRLLALHPEIWAARPRLDNLFHNVEWQLWYKDVWYTHERNPKQMPPGIGRPWPQKGTGRARHRTIRSPLWVDGGRCHGAQNPRSHFYMLPYMNRLNGLIHALSVKFAQDDVHIVRDLHIPSPDPEYIEDFIENQGWSLSTLFVDTDDIMPANITAATEKINHFNLMPVYGLNVHSMFYHSTLVLTESALNTIESKLLFGLHRTDRTDVAINSMRTPRPPKFDYRTY